MRASCRLAVILALLLAPRAADADTEVRHEGKTLAEWIAQARGKSADKAREAIRAVERARFLVDAPAVVVPALVEILSTGNSVTGFTAVGALASYGPLARDAVGALRSDARELDTARLAARIRIGEGVAEGLRAWAEDADRQLATADKVTRGMKLPKAVEYADTPFYYAMQSVFLSLTAGGSLGLRGEGVAGFAGKVLRRPYGPLVASTVLWSAEDLGAAAAPLAAGLVPFLKDTEPVNRLRAARALAWIPGLPPESTKQVLRSLSSAAHVPSLRSIVQGIAVTLNDPKDDVVTSLRGLAGHADRAIAAWAVAGLARRAVDREKILPVLLANLKNADPDVRVAAADGLLSIGEWTDVTQAEARKGLVDPDLRVRWRCGAIAATAGGDVEPSLDAVALGIEGPDDVERVAAIEAARKLGSLARPLRSHLKSWSELPCARIAEPARHALEAVGED